MVAVPVFQCSSASRKFLNRALRVCSATARWSFSALQRAENSSIVGEPSQHNRQRLTFSALQRAENSSIIRRIPQTSASRRDFQCSSASRKFLNRSSADAALIYEYAFSALQRAENSSIRNDDPTRHAAQTLSVLFSEPKIPQSRRYAMHVWRDVIFQCSSASRKFLNP